MIDAASSKDYYWETVSLGLFSSTGGSFALEARGKKGGETKGGQCLNTLCLRSGDSRTGIFRGATGWSYVSYEELGGQD